MCVFFFFKQKTAYEMRISDWSSDVCSSDLANGTVFHTWIYDRISLDIRGLKAGGSNWNNSINLRVGSGGSEETVDWDGRSEEHTSELQSLMRTSYAVICLKKKTTCTTASCRSTVA